MMGNTAAERQSSKPMKVKTIQHFDTLVLSSFLQEACPWEF